MIFGSGEAEERLYASAKTQMEVLKDVAPTVKEVVINDNEEPPTLTFQVEDPEDTFVSGKIIIKDEEGNQAQEITFDKLDDLKFELDRNNIKDFQKYTLEIFATYDFDKDKENEEHQTSNESLANKQFEILWDYKFTLTDLKIKQFDTVNHKVILEFNSTLDVEATDDYYIDTVVINGKTYEDVQKQGDIYTVEVPYETEERQELILEKAILNNLHEFTVENQKVVIFKKVTALAIPTLSEDKKTISTEIKINDEDEIATNLQVVLLGANGQEINRQDIERDTTEVTFDLSKVENSAGEYIVQVIATYNAEDGKPTHENEVITEGRTNVSVSAKIIEGTTSKYVEKEGNFDITYKIESNTANKVDTIDASYNLL